MSVGGTSNCTPCGPIAIPTQVSGGGLVDPNAGCFVTPAQDPNYGMPFVPGPSVGDSAPLPAQQVGYPPVPVTPGTEIPSSVAPDPMPVPAPGTVDANTGMPIPSAPIDAATGGAVPATPAATAPAKEVGGTDAVATAPAHSLPDWPTWKQEFARLGVDAANIDRIGAQPLTNEQLAAVYITIMREMESMGLPQGPGNGTAPGKPDGSTTPGGTPPGGTTPGGTTPGGKPDVDGPGQVPGHDKPGWNAQWEAKFRELGMPDSLIAIYAGAGAPETGLQAAYDFAKARREAFNANGWYDKLVQEKVPADMIWQLILQEKMPTDKEIRALYDAAHQQNMPNWKRKLQLGVTLFPGGELAQYALGRKLVSGKQIDRSEPLNMAFAAASGLAAFTAFRGLKNLGAGWKAVSALKGGTAELTKVGITMEQLGLHRQAAALNDAAAGAAQVLTGNTSKFMSLLPFTKAHRSVVGLGHLESAARAFNAGGAESLLAASSSGALAVQTLGRTFEDLMRGNMKIAGSANSYIGNITMPFKQLKAAPMALDESSMTIITNRALRAGKSGQTLTALLEAGGANLRNPAWIGEGSELAARLAALPGGTEHLRGAGQLLAADAAPILGANVSSGLSAVLGRVKPGVPQYYDNLVRHAAQPEWFTGLAQSATDDMVRTMSGAGDDAGRVIGSGADDVIVPGAADDVIIPGAGGADDAAAGAGAIDDVPRAGGSSGVADAAAGAVTRAPGMAGTTLSNLGLQGSKRTFVVHSDAAGRDATYDLITRAQREFPDARISVSRSEAGNLFVRGNDHEVTLLMRRIRYAVSRAQSSSTTV